MGQAFVKLPGDCCPPRHAATHCCSPFDNSPNSLWRLARGGSAGALPGIRRGFSTRKPARIKSFVRVEAISRRVLEEGIDWKWVSTGEYLDVLGTRLGINVAALIGHIAVRHYVMGEDAVEREARPEEIAQMQQLVRKGMIAGAVGFSTNQNPRHMREDGKPVASRVASTQELLALLEVLGDMNTGVIQLSGGGVDARGRICYASELARATGRRCCWRASA